MFHHIKGKVKPKKTKYLIIIEKNQIYNISININKTRRYIIPLSSLLKVGMKIVKAQLESNNPERRRNMEKVNKTINKLFWNNVAIKFYMLGSPMKSGNLGNVNSKIVVTKDSVGSGNRKMQILKKVLNPL